MLSYVGCLLKIKENKEIKVKKILRKSQPNFQHYGKKIKVQAKKWFSYKKKVYSSFSRKRSVWVESMQSS